MAMKLFDLLGVAGAPDPAAAAVALWPAIPAPLSLPPTDLRALVLYLQDALELRAVQPGASADGVGLYAELHVAAAPGAEALQLPSLPDVGFYLQPTVDTAPARLYVTRDPSGALAWIVEALPVEIRLPPGILDPLPEDPHDSTFADVEYPAGYEFPDNAHDGLRVVLRHLDHASIFVRVKVRRTREGAFVFEPAVPISIGRCLFMGAIPCRGLHDVTLLPSSTLGAGHTVRELPLEWARHTLARELPGLPPGQLVIRTLDVDSTREPLVGLMRAMTGERNDASAIELVLEDLAVPLANLLGGLPIPTHGRIGIRRSTLTESDPSSFAAYDLAADPVRIRIGSYFLLIDQLWLQTPATETDQWIGFLMAFAEAGSRVTQATGDREHESPPTEPHGRGPAFTLGLLDDWTIQLGVRVAGLDDATGTGTTQTETTIDEHGGVDHDTTTVTQTTTQRLPGWVICRLPIGNIALCGLGIKGGVSIKRLADPSGAFGWQDCFQLMVDIGLFGTDAAQTATSNWGDSTPFQLQPRNGQPLAMVLRDIGWDLGHFNLSGISFPDGAELRAFNVLRLIADELGWVSENNGASYFYFSGGIAIDLGGGSQSAPRTATAGETAADGRTGGGASGDHAADANPHPAQSSHGDGFGVTFDRLRFKVSGAASAPPFLLDGVAIDVRAGTFKLRGFGGYHSALHHDAAGDEYKVEEWGLGLTIDFNALALDFEIGAQFFYGSIAYTDPAHAAQNFSYWLFGAEFSPIPVGPFQIVRIRVLVASNLDPHLTENPQAPNMRLLKWYDDHEDGLALPEGRQFGDGVWDRVDGSLSLGIGAGLQFPGGNSVRLDLFVFYHKSPAEEGLLALLRVYLLHGDEPVAFGALELDFKHDAWAFMLGVDLNLNTILGLHCDVLKFLKLTGTLYASNKPATFAIGHLNDQDSWLQLLLRLEVTVFVLKLQVGICVEIVDGGPNGFGFLLAIQGLINLAILEIEAYLTLGVLVGAWRSESSAVGALVWFEAGLRIRLFFIFTFGISGRLQLDTLRSSPGYTRLSGDFHVDTPFFLPSINFHFEMVWDEPHPEQIANLQPPVGAASALLPGQRVIDLPVTPYSADDLEPVPDGGGRQRIKRRTIYTMEQLRAAPDRGYHGQPDAETVGVDATIALDFKPSVDSWLATGQTTPLAASNEPIDPHAAEIGLTYELVSLSILRRPRFGPGAGGAWRPLIAAETTALFDPLHPDAPNPSALTVSLVNLDWCGDTTSGGKTDPRRLLLNADTPFTVLRRDDAADEEHARTEPGWPCRPGGPPQAPVEHVLAFDGVAIGTRAPAHPVFTQSRSTLAWGRRVPVVGTARWLATSRHVARIALDTTLRTVASATLDQPVQNLTLVAGWTPQVKGTLAITGYRGTQKVVDRTIALETAPPAEIVLTSPAIAFTHVVVRASTTSPGGGLELVELRYVGAREEQRRLARQATADARRSRFFGGDGKLAWLANHEYEVTVQVRATSAMTRTAAAPQVALLDQRTRFVTKGLVGLNAVARPGGEVEPYVESRSPGPGLLVYGEEPIALAFTPGMNIVAPLDRAPLPTDPDERGQLLTWALVVERTSGRGTDTDRITQTAPDWVLAHRAVPPASLSLGRVLDATIFARQWRHATTVDPFRFRLERLLQSAGGCGAGSAPILERSQVLEHQPFDPATGEARWPAGQTFVAYLRRDGGPCVDRARFEPGDETAFGYARESGGEAAWTLDEAGSLVVPVGAGRHYAVFGEAAWNHLTARVRVELAPDGQAGLAVAVDGTGLGQALIAVLTAAGPDAPPHLQLLVRRDGTTTELVPPGGAAGGVALEATADTYDLEVTAFDDRVRVRCGGTQLEVDRGAWRDGKLALVATAGCILHGLAVHPLDGYAFAFTASRYASFEDHITSFTGEPAILAVETDTPAARHTVAQIFTSAAIAEAAQLAAPAGDADVRQARFDAALQELALPLRQQLTRLELTRLQRAGRTELFLVESPEPLPIGFDVTATLTDHFGRAVPLAVLPDGTRTRALLVPTGATGAVPLAEDHYRLTFALDRQRFRGDLPEARYHATASLEFGKAPLGGRPFIHIARTVSGNVSILQPSVPGTDTLLLATPLWNPGGVGGVYLNHPIGVYRPATWAVFDQDLAAMPAGAAFNLADVTGSGLPHRVTTANISGNTTWIDHPDANGNPNAIVLVTPNWSPPGGSSVYVNHPLGVWWGGSQWGIFCQDLAAMPANAGFNVYVARPPAGLVHTSTATSIGGDWTQISAPGIDGRADAVLIVTPNWNPPGVAPAYHNKNIGVFYTGTRWAIFNQDLSAMPAGRSFNVWLVGYATPPP